MRILIAGDYCDRYRVSEVIAKGDFNDLFGEVKNVIEACDYSIVNFEFPIADSESHPIFKCGPNLKGSKKSIDALKYAGFSICTLANNHILDQGADCCIETMKNINEAGIQTVGVGVNQTEASKILYINKGDEKVAIINCCEHEFSIATKDTAGANALNPLHQYYQIQEARKNASYVCLIIHGGHEHFQLPSPRMKELYRFFIDVGADVVVNHHQHCYSGYETYCNKHIFYGLGNFCFDGNRAGGDKSWHEGFMLVLDTSSSSINNFEIIPYRQCEDSASIQLFTKEQSVSFDNEILKLNRIIDDDILLNKEITSYYEKCSKAELNILNPYKSRIFNKLFNIGVLPSFIKGKKLALIFNHIFCESHLDKLRFALLKEIEKQ